MNTRSRNATRRGPFDSSPFSIGIPMSYGDAFTLARFVKAQDAPVGRSANQTLFTNAMAEVRAGKKKTHWVWFVYPQVATLGISPRSRYFAIRSVSEAYSYLEDPVLGQRILEAAQAILDNPQKNITLLFGSSDQDKVRSSMTIFAMLVGSSSVFQQVLDKFFGGEMCQMTRAVVEEEVEVTPAGSN